MKAKSVEIYVESSPIKMLINNFFRRYEIKKRWRCYFDQIFNMSHEDDFIDLNVPLTKNFYYTRRIRFLKLNRP